MATVYYKLKSAKDFDSISIEGHFVSVGNLKNKIFEAKKFGRGNDFDLVVINAQTNEEYIDESILIPQSSSVLICRLPGIPPEPLVSKPLSEQKEQVMENRCENDSKTSFLKDTQINDLDVDDFGEDVYNIPQVVKVTSSNPVNPISKSEEDKKIHDLANAPVLDCKQTVSGFGRGRGFGRGGFELQKPPAGYVCHRCKTPGHLIQHCPTNGDPNFDIKRFKPPTGIPKSMLMATPSGSYSLPSGDTTVSKPNEAAFEKEIDDITSTRNVIQVPPELNCPLCKNIMKDAVITSKCCFLSFCDKCIRDETISKSKCVCGAKNIVADSLLPNCTLRETISRILGTDNNSAGNRVQGKEFATTVAAKEGQDPLQNVEVTKIKGGAKDENAPVLEQETLEKGSITKVADMTNDSRNKESEVQNTQVMVDAEKKKKKKKANLYMNEEMQQNVAVESYMVAAGPFHYNPYWNFMYPAYMNPYVGNGMMPPKIPPYRDAGKHEMQMSREGFVGQLGQKVGLKRIRIESSKDEEAQRKVSKDVSSIKLMKNISTPRLLPRVHHQPPPDGHLGERKKQSTPPRTTSKRISSHHGYENNKYDDPYRRRVHRNPHRSLLLRPSAPTAVESENDRYRNNRPRILSRIEYGGNRREDEDETDSRKQKMNSSVETADFGGGTRRKYTDEEFHHHHKESPAESSDDEDRHFKRRRWRYESSPVKDNPGSGILV